jgi:hypothetical protein
MALRRSVHPPNPFSLSADRLSTCRPSALRSSRVRRSLPKFRSHKVLRSRPISSEPSPNTEIWHCLPVKLPVNQLPWGRWEGCLERAPRTPLSYRHGDVFNVRNHKHL